MKLLDVTLYLRLETCSLSVLYFMILLMFHDTANGSCANAGTYVQNIRFPTEVTNNLCCYFDDSLHVSIHLSIIYACIKCSCFEFDIVVFYIEAYHQYCGATQRGVTLVKLYNLTTEQSIKKDTHQCQLWVS